MSATGRGSKKIARDAYYTPQSAILPLLPYIRLHPKTIFLEPCRGSGAIYNLIKLPTEQKRWTEIAEGRDYMTTRCKADLIITNPPFTLALAFLQKSLMEAPTVVYLLRLSFLASTTRKSFWQSNKPTHIFVLSSRPSFTGRGTDAADYAWFCWDRADRVKTKHWLTIL